MRLAWADNLDDWLESGKLVRVSALEATPSRGHFVPIDRTLAGDDPARVIAQILAADSSPQIG